MCDDIKTFVSTMKARNVVCDPVQDEGWGLLSHLTLPGGGQLGVYEPRHARPPVMTTEEGAKGGASNSG